MKTPNPVRPELVEGLSTKPLMVRQAHHERLSGFAHNLGSDAWKLERFFEKFDQFADAPNAVTKMRELMLELAVRGKLVAQGVDDEPASELLKRVHAEKVRRNARSEPSDEELKTISNDEDFAIPGSWQWVGATTPVVMVSDQGKKVQTKDTLGSGKYPVVDQGKVFIRGYCNDPDKVISVTEPIVLFGDHTRETKLIDFDFVVGADGVKLLQPVCIDPRFYFLALQWLPLESRGYGRHFRLLRAARIPLPPLAEQKRIVAKVDELMALCDRLEAQQQERDTRHAALARASLARFAEAPTPANLDFLFHNSYTITPADLRKSILTLAIQGKLVPQDPDDEPMANNGGRNGELSTQALFEIPEQWAWAQLSELADINGGFAFKSSAYLEEGTRVVRISDFDEFGFKDHKIVRHPFTPDLQKFMLSEGNILMAMTGGTVGKSYYIRSLPETMVVNQRVATIKVSSQANPSYIDILIRSEMTQEVIRAAKNSTNDNISMADIKGFAIPLPPLAEQRRIVAKVDALMALVDQLETQLTASRATAEKLMEAVVAELTVQN